MTYNWQKQKAQASHTDDWLITYADVITLLLCFFVIIVISSAAKKEAPQTQTLQSLDAKSLPTIAPPLIIPVSSTPSAPPALSPALPELFPGNLPFRPIEQTDFAAENVAKNLPSVENDAPAKAPVAMPLSTANADEENMAALFDAAAVMAVTSPSHVEAPAPEPSPPQIAPDLKVNESAPFEKKGDRITSLEMNSAAFFDSGSAVLSSDGMAILETVAVKLKSDDLKEYRITVEGHTDDTPIHTAQFASNWELSTARASSVVHFLLDQGIPATKLRAAGYADTFPKVPNRDESGSPLPANRAENRRVVIKLEKIETD